MITIFLCVKVCYKEGDKVTRSTGSKTKKHHFFFQQKASLLLGKASSKDS